MPKNMKSSFTGKYPIYIFIFCLLLIGLLTYYSWIYGVISFIILSVLMYITYLSEIAAKIDVENYIKTIQYRVKKTGTDILQNLNIGVILYDEVERIIWHNPYLNTITRKDNIIGDKIQSLIPTLKLNGEKETEIEYENKVFKVNIYQDERLLYLYDITEYVTLLEQYDNEKPVLGIIHFDNIDEATAGLDELTRSLLLTEVTGTINDWADDLGLYLKRISVDKFLIVTNQIVLEQLEIMRFDILDIVREMTKDNKIPLTLSIGIGAGVDSFIELGQLAQVSLDIALGRGGDQAAVKVRDKIIFYGGKSNAVEKRTRVRARVISHALRDLIKESDLVLIMGHNEPDMDAIGSAIGVLKAVKINGKKGYIILDEPNIMIQKLLDEITVQGEYQQYFINSQKALQIATEKTLLILIDTHKPSLTIEPKLIDKIDKKVIIDHHRRGEEMVEDAVLIYIEPYASSASELVTELLQYQVNKIDMNRIEASTLLAGIIVDTKSFTYRTGYRTFEAASFLRTNGADPILIQFLLKEDLNQYIKRAELVKKAKIIFNNIAIIVAKEKLNQMEMAQVADTLVDMDGILASFVISKRHDGIVSISARSLGEINVQVIMEQLGGGGHLTNASAQIDKLSLNEAEAKLTEVLKATLDKGGNK